MPEAHDPKRGEDQADVQAFPPLVKAYIDKQVEHAVKQHTEAESKAKKFRNSWRAASPITKGSFYMTAGIAAATIAYAITAIFQLIAMHSTLKTMKTSSDESSQQIWSAIGNMNWLARSADLSQKSTQESVDDNRKAAAEDRRPWIGFEGVTCSECTVRSGLENTKTLQYLRMRQLYGVLVNSGKTPAFGLKVNSTNVIRMKSDPIPTIESLNAEGKKQIEVFKKMHVDTSDLTQKSSGVMAPNSRRNLIFFGDGAVEYGREFTGDRTKWKVIYLIGRITYWGEDRRTKHTTSFCMVSENWSNGISGFNFCPTGNDMN